MRKTRFDPQEYEFKDDICIIKLCDNHANVVAEAMIDANDYDKIKRSKWHMNSRGYVMSGNLYLHHAILGKNVDHISGDKLDNRKSNLRFCTQSQNLMNKRMQSNNTSGYRGVGKNGSNWYASIMKERKEYHIGTYPNPEEAAIAYNEKAKELFGEFARLNEI